MENSPDETSAVAVSEERAVNRSSSVAVVGLVSIVLIVPALLYSPGIGVILALVIIGILLWHRKTGLRAIGFKRPPGWAKTIGTGLLLGLFLQLVAFTLLDPLLEFFTGEVTDLSEFESLRGDLGMLLIWLAIVWLFVVFVEEFVFRGFLMNEIVNILGGGTYGLYLNLIFCSVLFGLAHWYQGPSGVVSTGLVGLLLGYIFIKNGFNLWLPIFTHGFLDTVGLTMIYLNIV